MWLLTFLIVLLLVVIGLIVYANWPTGAAPAQPMGCSSCGGQTPPPSSCNQCNNFPCQCSQILPGQTQCPMCPGMLGQTRMPGLGMCRGCGRGYRCPGCMLGGTS